MISPSSSPNRRLRDGAAFVVAGALYWWLGTSVARSPVPAFDRAALPITGHGVPLAIVFTVSCYLPVLLALAAIALAAGVRWPAWRARTIFSVVLTLAAWRISDAAKAYFARPRPDDWVAILEHSPGYSSGHALYAAIVFGLWASYFANSDLPVGARRGLAIALSLWACGVLWSRLALGAHFATDLIGGVLLGVALLSLARLLADVVARGPLAL